MATPKLVLFDAYGTLFDVYSVSSTAEQIFPGQGAALSVLWRDKQIEYTRLRAMAGRYKPFWDITIAFAQCVFKSCGLSREQSGVASVEKSGHQNCNFVQRQYRNAERGRAWGELSGLARCRTVRRFSANLQNSQRCVSNGFESLWAAGV